MIKVRVGIDNLEGYVNISYRDYEWEMAIGGNAYKEVFTKEGIKRFRCKYLRNVEEVKE